MSPEDHKALARRFFEEVWNQQRLDVVDDIFAATVVFNGQAVPRERIKELVASAASRFPIFG